MSAISDFNKVWVQKFPGSQLPSAWEEDVKTNLSKHKQRVSELQEELEKEQVYVQFLESLLEEVEKRKTDPEEASAGGNRNSNIGQENDINDVIKDTLERRCLAAQGNSVGVGVPSIREDPIVEEAPQNNHTRETMANSSCQTEECKTDDERLEEGDSLEQDLSGDEATDDIKDHFVTVIEVNGLEKDKSAELPSSQKSSAPRATNDEVKRLKKVPPRPPPKNFKMSGQETASWVERRPSGPSSNDLQGTATAAEDEGLSKKPVPGSSKLRAERPIIFDSRKKSTDNGSSPTSSLSNVNQTQQTYSMTAAGSGNTGSGPGILFQKPQNGGRSAGPRKFEGSKQPLPSVHQNDLDTKLQKPLKGLKPTGVADLSAFSHISQQYPVERENSSKGRSKILDLVNKMESNNKPAPPSKNIEQLTPKRSGSSFKKAFQGPLYQHTTPVEPEPSVSDYIDPCDADFELNNDQIYDSPPPESEFSFSLETGKKNSKTGTLESQISGGNADRAHDLDDEPMYDVVAPDQEDDYVLLMEEGNCSASSSLKKDKKCHQSSGNFHSENALPSSNNDIATIKSQTSVISGQSAATTSSGTSDTDGVAGSPLPHDGAADLMHKNSSANYVNIDYFLGRKSARKDSHASGESEDDETPLLRAISYDQDVETDGDNPDGQMGVFEIESGQYGGSTDGLSSFGNSTPLQSSRNAKSESPTMTVADQEKYAMFRFMLTNIAESEASFVDVLSVMLQYMKALKATLATSKPVMSTDEFNIIFYKIPELYELHQKFLLGLQQKTPVKRSVGKHFEHLAQEIGVYGAFLQNYSRAVDTVRKCSQNNAHFGEITRNIRLRSMNKNQAVSLETLLYSPVSRIQKNIEIIQDLLKCLPITHPDHVSLKTALREFQSFLSGFQMIQPEELVQGLDRNRHLVKNSFIVELSEGHRKLRHIFLFNDVLVCAKYKASGKSDKFTFELKWYIPVAECIVVEESSEPRESAPINLVALRSQASTVRDQIKRQTSRDDPKKTKADKQRKKLAELEAQLVLASPNLVFKVKAGNGRSYTFFLSSEFERSQWVDAIEALKANRPSSSPHLSMNELQSWLTSCRKHLKTNMGSYLLRTGRDENLLVGDFYILIDQLKGIQRAADLYICLEVDSYGHFFRKAKTKMICGSTQPCWSQDFTIELEGAQNLRILLYEDHPRQGTLIRAKTTIELNRTWLTGVMSETKIELQDYVLTISTKFIPSEMTIRRVPTAKPSGLFGAKITQVCKREKRQVPFILTSCVREVERRGLNEVGIYRVSGSTSDVSRLKKAFETNSYEAEQLLKDVDIHSVTGSLKLYMRELPEALFTDDLYPKFFEAFNLQDMEVRRKTLIHFFNTLPPINQHIINFLLDHMVRVNKHENHNKMSLHNMATVFGPTLLRPGTRNEGSHDSYGHGGQMSYGSDLLAAGTVDVMAQAGILYFFLTRRSNEESLQPLSS